MPHSGHYKSLSWRGDLSLLTFQECVPSALMDFQTGWDQFGRSLSDVTLKCRLQTLRVSEVEEILLCYWTEFYQGMSKLYFLYAGQSSPWGPNWLSPEDLRVSIDL